MYKSVSPDKLVLLIYLLISTRQTVAEFESVYYTSSMSSSSNDVDEEEFLLHRVEQNAELK